MPGLEITKPQVLRDIRNTLLVLEKAAEACATVSEVPELPLAFSVVAKHLPLTITILTSLTTHIKSASDDEEVQQLRDMYPVIKGVTCDCSENVRILEDLFETVMQSDVDTQTKLRSYRSGVQFNGGKMVEKVMLDLLNLIMSLEPLTTQEQIQTLQEALEEVKKVPPSLEDAPGAGVVMNNSGPGSMFYYGGKGHMNVNTGGFQVTGDNHNATYNYTEHLKAAESARP
ncbi:hypothetical protein N7451_005839 [Penicillium sp. IBT 35674x]|nr:hypothetical protein N7451_005839 [Penicillium sp. IBT 35674x]